MGLDRIHLDERSPHLEFDVTISSTRTPKPVPMLLDHLERASDHRASPLPVQQLLILFILFILSIHVP